MAEPFEVFRWWVRDERTGKRRLTSFHMSEADALDRYPGAEREPSSREERRQAGGAADILTKR